MTKFTVTAFILFSALTVQGQSTATDYNALSKNLVDVVGALVESKPITGSEMNAVPVLKKRLDQLGLKYEYIESKDAEGKDIRPNFVVRLPATAPSTPKKKAMLVLAHIDVVAAIGQKWSEGLEPHKMVIKDGFAYGRGISDMLSYLAGAMEIVGEIQRTKVALERDLIFMLTSDEEKGGYRGIQWLMQNRPDLFKDIEFAVSEGGSVLADEKVVNGQQQPLFIGYAAAEKIYQDYKILATGPTGHSSAPTKTTAINLLNEAIAKIRKIPAPPALTDLIKSYVTERAKVETDARLKELLLTLATAKVGEDLNKNKKYADVVEALRTNYKAVHALLRRTCVTTVLSSGSETAKNALPPTATAYVNCRLMPHEDVDAFTAYLKGLIDVPDEKDGTKKMVEFTPEPKFYHGPASRIDGPVPAMLAQLAQSHFGGIPVIPAMLTGGTDSRFLRMNGIDAYGIGPVLSAEADRVRAHGVDERIFLGNLPTGLAFFHKMILGLVAPNARIPASASSSGAPAKASTNFKNAFSNHDSHAHGAGCQH